MGFLDFLDEHPLEPDDIERARTAAEAAVGSGTVLVQAVHRPGDTFVGALRVVDLETHRDDRGERAKRIRDALREAGYEANVKGAARAAWPDVEVSRLGSAEWKRRQGRAT